MKRIVLFMVMISMVCIASYAQKAAEGTKVLVAYFSATGNTEKAAQQVASIVSGDLHKIQPEKSYTSADLNWRDKSSRSSVEMDDPTSRPAIIDDLKNLAEYDTVYLGFPIWWNQAKTHQHLFGEIRSLGQNRYPIRHIRQQQYLERRE